MSELEHSRRPGAQRVEGSSTQDGAGAGNAAAAGTEEACWAGSGWRHAASKSAAATDKATLCTSQYIRSDARASPWKVRCHEGGMR